MGRGEVREFFLLFLPFLAREREKYYSTYNKIDDERIDCDAEGRSTRRTMGLVIFILPRKRGLAVEYVCS